MLENSDSGEKLNVAAPRAATSKIHAGTQPWAEPPQGAGKDGEMHQGKLPPFQPQDTMGF